MTRATPGRRGVHLGLRGGAAGAMDRMITGGSALTQKAVPENFRPGTFLSSMGGEREREREREREVNAVAGKRLIWGARTQGQSWRLLQHARNMQT